MSSRRERADKQQHHKRTKNLIISIILGLVIMIYGSIFAFHQLNKQDKIDTQVVSSPLKENKKTTDSNIDSKESSNLSSSSIDSSDSEISNDVTSSQDNEITNNEKKMLHQRIMIQLGVNKFVYNRTNENTPKLMYMKEITGGFSLYYDDGSVYNVRDMGYIPNIESRYDFGESHGFEMYFDHTPAVRLETPDGIGDPYVGREIPEQDLEKYAIR
ncbi:hypothetical protein AB0Y21_05430 [Weissella paramesenteroides]|uniref:hypothetical protein n=1 Tax=Weissella paramesenteroides TaxID=1249 RepID=UPI003F232955